MANQITFLDKNSENNSHYYLLVIILSGGDVLRLKRFTKIITIFIVLIFISKIQYCKGENQSSHSERIKVGYTQTSFYETNPKDLEQALKTWTRICYERMKKKWQKDYPAEIVYYDKVSMMLNGIKKNKLDFIVLSSLDFLRARNIWHLKPILISIKKKSILEKFILAANTGNGTNKLNKLKNKKLMIGEWKGGIPELWIDTLLMKSDLPESSNFFRSVSKVEKVSQAVLPVYFNQADACIVTYNAFLTCVELNPDLGKQIKILSESPGFLPMVLCSTENCDEEKSKYFREVCNELHLDTDGRQMLTIFRFERLADFKPSYLENIESLYNEYNQYKAKRINGKI